MHFEQANRPHVAHQAAGVGPGEEGQLLHDPALPTGGGVDRGEEFAITVLGPGVFEGQAGIRPDDRQRCTQLVGGVRGGQAWCARVRQGRCASKNGSRLRIKNFLNIRYRLITKLLGQSDDDALRATQEAEPVDVLVLRDLADEFGTVAA
jgi:hypothetical protein